MDLGGTDPRLLDDEDFVELLVQALQADYRALDGYRCGAEVRIAADIHAIGGHGDHRVPPELLQAWATHTRGTFTHTEFDGGHFYLDGHLAEVARLLSDSQ